MSGYVLDTGVVIRHLRGKKQFVSLLRGLGKSNRLAISSVTRLEIFAGVREGEIYQTRKLLSRFVNFAVDEEIAERAGFLVARSRERGRLILVADAIVAATAIVNQADLVTLNRGDFELISSLRLYEF